ncbi:hypothetical protein CHGG_01210 [Chaetomium globosum CBS 148.51]|uniref:Uncharacterized protein n=1 Tax=Chaetomium globosum (strain ATCC 6205 / CBS 148.51 / DSM 1962 / NBRC 6347 / NRRL 1970) TaxID=306901 RepID=Q2HEZ4_CHAGB|nr:uncharacterized protein CHGG_01210 [Chaetomium globosum CBS 148.51]EAQ92975.1 hypothetical protein CHGG_01210 [Chaetomium globosum CBS 148.51]
MARLPAAEKLPLALRKNVRDEWENNKADLESQLSEVLGTAWTIEVNPLAIWPYHNDGYAKESLGSCIKAYVEGAIYQLKYQSSKHGDEYKTEINTICSAHLLTLDLEETSPARFSYGGCDVHDGQLRILFVEGSLGTNIDDCLSEDKLTAALNAAPSDAPLSFVARTSIRADYDPKIGEVREQIATLLGQRAEDVKLNANFDANFAALDAARKAGDSSVREDWEGNLGSFTLQYFEGLAYQMKDIKVGEDEMVQEGVLEAVSSNEYAFRVVDKLKNETYCEVEIEEGVLYLQCTPGYFGTNVNDAAAKLMDKL